jgi:hypothetical protein
MRQALVAGPLPATFDRACRALLYFRGDRLSPTP